MHLCKLAASQKGFSNFENTQPWNIAMLYKNYYVCHLMKHGYTSIFMHKTTIMILLLEVRPRDANRLGRHTRTGPAEL